MTDTEPQAGMRPAPWLAGPLTTALGLAAHIASGGTATSLPIIAALTALLCMAAAILGRLQGSIWAWLTFCAFSQQFVHLGFSAFLGPAADGPAGHGHTAAIQIPAPGDGPAPAHHSLHLMLHLHAAAALSTYGVLRYWPRVAGQYRRLAARGPIPRARV